VAVGKPWANLAGWLVGGLAAWGIVAGTGLDLIDMLASSKLDQARFAIDAGSIVTGVAAAGFLFRPIRKDAAAFLRIDVDNPVHTLALVLAVILFGTQVSSLLLTDVLGSLSEQQPQTLVDVFIDELPLLILAVAGVGIFIRRPAAETAERLGVVRPAWWQLVVGLAAAGVFFGFVIGVDAANHYLLPDTARRVDAVNSHLFGQLATTGWWGVLVIAFLPGICEELLFRGALQPRLGLVTAAVLFTSIHSQYGLSLDLAAIFVIAVCLGLLRKWTNTTTSMTAHVAYNLLAGISIAGTWLYVGLGAEAVLVAAAALLIWRQVRRMPPGQANVNGVGGQTG
jgi:CAAX protease family protein